MAVRTPRVSPRRPSPVRLVAPPDPDLEPEHEPEVEAHVEASPPRVSSPRWSGLRRRGLSGGPRWRSAVLAAVVLVAVLGLLVWTGLRWYDARQLAGAHQAALAAAKQTTVDFVTISASSVDSDLQRIADGATGDFKDEFTRGMPEVRAAVVQNSVQSQGSVLRAGLVSGDRDSATVLVAIDATVRNARAPDGRLSHYRIQVDLALDSSSGRWLVSRLQFVG